MYFTKNISNFFCTKGASLLFSVFCIMILAGCNDVVGPQAVKKGEGLKYFDLKGYLEKESERLSKSSAFTKTVYVDTDQETKVLSGIDLETELAPFINSDINKPAWSDKYEIDSIFNAKKELVGLHYHAKDDKLKTKRLLVDFENNVVSKIFIENTTSTTIANTGQILTYQPAEGFSMESKQDISLMDERSFKIDVRF